MRSSILLAFADDPSQRRVTAASSHEVRVGIGAVVEEELRDCYRVFDRRRVIDPCEAQIQQRLPAWIPRTGSAGEELLPLRARGALWSAFTTRRLWICGDDALHFGELTANNGSVDVVTRHLRML